MKPHPAKDKPSPRVGPQLSTGFPSPAEDYEEPPLDLHDLVVTNPLATYFLRVDTEAMQSSGLHPGDILVVDRSITALADRLVVIIHEDNLQVVRCRAQGELHIFENDLETLSSESAVLWGTVTYVVHKAH